MKKQQFIYIVCLAALVSGCNIYKPYSRPEMDTKGLYRDPVSATDTLVSDTTNMGDLPWREVFTDPQLQSLIQLGLEQNTDLQTAIPESSGGEAGLMSARLAYTPSLNLAPQGGLSWYENHRRTWTWSAPIAASWEIDIFGKLLNAKRGAKAAPAEPSLQASRPNPGDRRRSELLLHAADARRTARHHRKYFGTVEEDRRDDAGDERGRMVNEAAIVQERSEQLHDRSVDPGTQTADPRDRERAVADPQRGSAADRTGQPEIAIVPRDDERRRSGYNCCRTVRTSRRPRWRSPARSTTRTPPVGFLPVAVDLGKLRMDEPTG